MFKASLLIFGSLLLLISCNQTKKVKNKNSLNKTFEAAVSTKKDGNPVSKYADGRISEVRTLTYYNFYTDTILANKNEELKLILVITEWNKYEALVADSVSTFTQLPSNTMLGGDVETNRRMKKSAVRYFDIANKMFEKEVKKLPKMEVITNRDANYVTIDFITNKGFFTIQEQKSKLENNQSIWSNLFKESKLLSIEVEKTMNTNKWKG